MLFPLKNGGNLDEIEDVDVVLEKLKWFGRRKVRCIKMLLFRNLRAFGLSKELLLDGISF